MCALSPCCKSESCKKVVVTSSINKQLTQIKQNPNCILIGTGSYTSGNEEFNLEVYGSKSDHRPQEIDKSEWDNYDRNSEKFKSRKNAGMDQLTFKV